MGTPIKKVESIGYIVWNLMSLIKILLRFVSLYSLLQENFKEKLETEN